MDIQEEREAFESWWEGFHNGRQIACDYIEEDNSYSVGYANAQWVAWQAKAQAVPNTQALHDRLLVKSIKEHVESHIAEISVNDLFDKGWLAAMKCIQNNINMIEHRSKRDD